MTQAKCPAYRTFNHGNCYLLKKIDLPSAENSRKQRNVLMKRVLQHTINISTWSSLRLPPSLKNISRCDLWPIKCLAASKGLENLSRTSNKPFLMATLDLNRTLAAIDNSKTCLCKGLLPSAVSSLYASRILWPSLDSASSCYDKDVIDLSLSVLIKAKNNAHSYHCFAVLSEYVLLNQDTGESNVPNRGQDLPLSSAASPSLITHHSKSSTNQL